MRRQNHDGIWRISGLCYGGPWLHQRPLPPRPPLSRNPQKSAIFCLADSFVFRHDLPAAPDPSGAKSGAMADTLMAKLTATAVKALLRSPGKYGDGDGLWLHVRKPGQAYWALHYGPRNGQRMISLGSPRRSLSPLPNSPPFPLRLETERDQRARKRCGPPGRIRSGRPSQSADNGWNRNRTVPTGRWP